MNIAIIDISGTIPEYCAYLTKASNVVGDKNTCVTLFCPHRTQLSGFPCKKMLALVPAKYGYSTSVFKRCFKAIEAIINYSYLVIYSLFHQIDVFHFEWFPFLEVVGIEKFFVKAIKLVRPHSKVVYTHHNLFPHDYAENKKESYRERARDIFKLVDSIVVHTQTSKNDVVREFGVLQTKVSVCHHGIFYPIESFEERGKNDDRFKLLMFGNQSIYKGTDIFVEALSLLSKKDMDKVSVKIVGYMNSDVKNKCQNLIDKLHIECRPVTVSNSELYQEISSADCLVYPYRNISQSGALLLGLYFEKLIIASNLPSFLETLVGFEPEWFFEKGKSIELSKLISRYINGEIDVALQRQAIKNLKQRYSWEEIAKHYFECVY